MNDLIQSEFDYGVLTPDQAQRTQDAEIKIIGRTQKAILENGKDLLAVKEDIGHGHFLNWLHSIGLSERTAQDWMSAAKNFGEIRDARAFENRAMYLLSSSKVPEPARKEAKQRAEEGEKITEEIAKQIRDAHKARELAEERAKQIEQKSLLALLSADDRVNEVKGQLQEQEEQSRETITDLTRQITILEEAMQRLTTPEVEIREVTPEATLHTLQSLQKQVERLTYERDNEAARAESFAKQFRNDLLAKKEDERQERIRQQLRTITAELQSAFREARTHWPSALDTQSYGENEWTALEEVQAAARHFLQECQALRQRTNTMIVDAG